MLAKIALACLALTVSAFSANNIGSKITIVAPKAREHDAGYVLACEHVGRAIRSKGHNVSVVWLTPSAKLPAGNVILVGRRKEVSGTAWRPDKPEGYRIRPISLSGRKSLLVEGDERGTMYGLFKLAERIYLGDDLWQIDITSAPAFPLRIFSELGQLLDIPDIGYYTEQPPYVNERLLREEVDEAKQLIRHIVSLGYNSFAVLNLGVEEYIDYRYLDKQVYAPNDRHRTRSVVFCRYLTELCEYAHSLGVDVYLQVYEIQFPPQLDKLYGVELDSPNIERIITARYKELFERIPLDGMIITATEVHPRAGYQGKQLWRKKGLAGAGRMLTMYHNACKAAGKKSIFRLWRVAGDAEGLQEVTRHVPKDAVLAIKNTGGDYYLDHSTTTAITSGIARERPLVVLFDTFREFDGWSRLFCYMKRWGDVVRCCRDNGVLGINAWGPWAPGCIWPDYEPNYMKDGQDCQQKPGMEVSWRGHWNSFRMFTRGFTPGQANVYLLGRLGWDPDADVEQIARDFAALHVGEDNVSATVQALLASEDAFAEEYVKGTHPGYLKWTMVFSPRDSFMEKAYKHNSLEQILASNSAALKHVAEMEKAFARTDPGKAADAERYRRFKEGIDKTALYLRTFYLLRECCWRDHYDSDLSGGEKKANAAALEEAKTRVMSLFEQWQRYPEEAGFWRITFRYGRPTISPNGVFPHFYPRDNTTMETTVKSFGVSCMEKSEEVFSKEKIIAIMNKVNDYQYSHPWIKDDRNWIRGTYYTGVMALYKTTQKQRILNQVTDWAQKHKWMEGTEDDAPANRLTCGQTYLELYFLMKKPEMIEPLRRWVDSGEFGSPSAGGVWYGAGGIIYADSLYVAPPTLAMLAKATGQAKYLEYMNKMYWDVVDELFDKDFGLFYRDKRFKEATTENGKKVFWSRGNGWVIAGIPRILEYLPEDNPYYNRYVTLLKTMAASIAKAQGSDGLWRTNLADAEQYPGPEASGSAFFCYAMAWGINNGLLDKQKYQPIVEKAWKGLVRCVGPDGKLGYVQPVGDRPKPAAREMTHEYATGAFLLAGSEVIKL